VALVHRIIGSIAAAALSVIAAGPAAARTLEAVASFTILADVVRNVGGAHVHVSSLVGPNGDPHAFEPSPDDARRLRAADMVFVSGLGLEGWMDRLIAASGTSRHPVAVSAGITPRKMKEDGPIEDPHVWNSPENVVIWVKNIEAALAAADPQDAADFHASAARYIEAVHAVDAHARAEFAQIPPVRRKILTSHDAFGYFGDAYGIEFLAPLGVSTESEASAAAVAKLIGQIKAEKVKVYFFENSNDPRLVDQIAGATGAEPGGRLYVESLSEADGPAPTYLAMMRYNVDALANAMRRAGS
jgi:zinc/manganese transport system substrate-binding protein